MGILLSTKRSNCIVGLHLRGEPISIDYINGNGMPATLNTTGNWALITSPELPGNNPPAHFANHTVVPPTGEGFIGYIFPNRDGDSDGIIDGWEKMLGLNQPTTIVMAIAALVAKNLIHLA